MTSPVLHAPARLVDELHMLTGLTLAYGSADAHEAFSVGLAREVLLNGRQFVPAPTPITERTVYDLASLTKLFTCVSVFLLLEKRDLRMTDCVGRIDPRFRRLRDTSLYDLLCYRAILKSPQRIDAQASAAEAEAQVFSTYVSPVPQTKIYSDMNALVLKYLIEAVTGVPYIDFLRSSIFEPLNMRETWGKVPADRLADCMDYNYEHCIINGQYRISRHVLPGTAHDPKARALDKGEGNPCGHAGLFSTRDDMVRFAQGLLSGKLLSVQSLALLGVNRTGSLKTDGGYRQYMGFLAFSKSAVPRLSEVPLWMGKNAFALSGYTGNHIAIDPDKGVFDLLLGNRCHHRLSTVLPDRDAGALPLADDGSGLVKWPDGHSVYSSYKYVYLKDQFIHAPVLVRLKQLGWIKEQGERYGNGT